VITIYQRNEAKEAFLGYVKIRPPRANGKMQENWFRLAPRLWKEKVTGDIHIQLGYRTVEVTYCRHLTDLFMND
jgi:hypothetical protein